jgi:hypothetical protein
MTLDQAVPHDPAQQPATTSPAARAAIQPETRPPRSIVENDVTSARPATRLPSTDAPDTTFPREPDLHFLRSPILPAPDFPVEALPEGARRFIAEAARGQKTHPAFLFTSALATVAGAVGTSAHLWVSEDWREPCVIWTLLSGSAGTGKSVAMSKTVHVLTTLGIAALERAAVAPGEEALAQVVRAEKARRLQRAIRAGLDRAETDFSGYVVPEDAAPSPAALNTCTSTTLPGILERITAQPRGLLLAQPDVIGLIRGPTLRSDEGRAALLQAYDGDPYVRDRATGAQVIPALQLSLCGGVTPDKLRQVIGAEDDGLLARCLVSYPQVERDPELGQRGTATTPAIEPVLRQVLALPAARERFGGHAVLLSEHARRAVESASRRWARIAAETGGMLASTYNRATTQALRVGLVLAILEHALAGKAGLPRHLNEDCTSAAVSVMDAHFLPSAERALDHAQARPDPDRDLRAIAGFIARNVEEEKRDGFSFNARTLREARRAPCPRDHRAWTEALERLAQAGCIADAPPRNATGRARTDYRVHPAFVAAARTAR